MAIQLLVLMPWKFDSEENRLEVEDFLKVEECQENPNRGIIWS